MARPIPPEMQALFGAFRQMGGRVLAAGLSKALEEAGRFTEEVDRRIKRGARQASRMANGQEPEDDDDP